MLLMTSSLEDLLMARDTLTFILEHLGFLVNIKKLIVDSVGMPLSLPKEKVLKVINVKSPESKSMQGNPRKKFLIFKP